MINKLGSIRTTSKLLAGPVRTFDIGLEQPIIMMSWTTSLDQAQRQVFMRMFPSDEWWSAKKHRFIKIWKPRANGKDSGFRAFSQRRQKRDERSPWKRKRCSRGYAKHVRRIKARQHK